MGSATMHKTRSQLAKHAQNNLDWLKDMAMSLIFPPSALFQIGPVREAVNRARDYALSTVTGVSPERVQQLRRTVQEVDQNLLSPERLNRLARLVDRVENWQQRLERWWNTLTSFREWPNMIWSLIKSNPMSAAGVGVGLLWLLNNLFTRRSEERSWSDWLLPLGVMMGLPLLEQYAIKPAVEPPQPPSNPVPTSSR